MFCFLIRQFFSIFLLKKLEQREMLQLTIIYQLIIFIFGCVDVGTVTILPFYQFLNDK